MTSITINASYHNYINCATVDTINGIPVTLVKEEEEDDTGVYIYTSNDIFQIYTLTYLREYPHLSTITYLTKYDTTETYTLCDPNITFNIKYKA
jgi:hypothetical protein